MLHYARNSECKIGADCSVKAGYRLRCDCGCYGEVMKSLRFRLINVSLLTFAIGWITFAETAHCQAHQDPPKDAAAPAVKDPDSSYVIGDDDILAINIRNQEDFRQAVPVRPDGKISLPLIGDIQAEGQTPMQLQGKIVEKLRTYITHPDVTVIVQQINSKKFNILGRVVKPGAYPLSTSTTVLDAIAQAGGFQDFAKRKDIYILRENPDGSEIRFRFNYKDVILGMRREQNIKLEPNDTVVVP
jgi:polysaccharide biosynthesis/export protein